VGGLDGATVDEVLAVPADIADHLGLAQAISPLRLRGMGAILARLQRQVRSAAGRGRRDDAAACRVRRPHHRRARTCYDSSFARAHARARGPAPVRTPEDA
jgi:hypothetical protein